MNQFYYNIALQIDDAKTFNTFMRRFKTQFWNGIRLVIENLIEKKKLEFSIKKTKLNKGKTLSFLELPNGVKHGSYIITIHDTQLCRYRKRGIF